MKIYGLIGYPLGHSFSKQYFNEKFEKENIVDCFFEAYPIKSIAEFGDLMNNPEIKGLCVTIPYKEQVLQYMDELSDEVKYIGAANCIKITANKLTAYNTDIIGFEQSFSKALAPGPTKALILGTGGASKAVQYVLRKMDIPFLLVSRNQSSKEGYITYSDIDPAMMEEYNVIINTTPLGMSPNESGFPEIPYQLITPHHYLYDLVYKPAKTLFLQKGAERGATIQNGYEMLIIQAEANWVIWNS